MPKTPKTFSKDQINFILDCNSVESSRAVTVKFFCPALKRHVFALQRHNIHSNKLRHGVVPVHRSPKSCTGFGLLSLVRIVSFHCCPRPNDTKNLRVSEYHPTKPRSKSQTWNIERSVSAPREAFARYQTEKRRIGTRSVVRSGFNGNMPIKSAFVQINNQRLFVFKVLAISPRLECPSATVH